MNTRLLTLITLTAALGACSSMPERNSDLDRAQGRLRSAQNDAQVAQLAPDELKQASDTLVMAEKAWSDNEPKSKVDHLAYMGAQRVVVAQESASSRASQAVIAGAAAERDRMRLQQRTAEADRARQQLASAEQSNANKTAALAQADAATLREQARADSSDARANALAQQLLELNAKKTERGYVVTLQDVLFDTGQARLMPESAGFLARLADAFKRNASLTAAIEGYTDSVGGSNANYELSDRRANAVKTALMSLGVRDEQLTVRGFGENNPVASNDTVDGRQMNRRVEIVFGSQSGLVLAK